MKTLTKLSARSLEYYIDSSRWKSELDFFNVEVVFLNRLMDEHFLQLSGKGRIEKLTLLSNKLSVLINEKHQVKELLDQQLKDLELLAENLLNESPEGMPGRQAHLEYKMLDLIHEYREVKEELYTILEVLLDEHRLLVN